MSRTIVVVLGILLVGSFLPSAVPREARLLTPTELATIHGAGDCEETMAQTSPVCSTCAFVSQLGGWVKCDVQSEQICGPYVNPNNCVACVSQASVNCSGD